MLDLKITGGTVIDGTGAASRRADVGVKDGRIVAVGEVVDEAENIRRGMWEGQFARFYVTANGQMVTHPLVTQLKDLRTQMTTWLAAIGFSPSDRARLGLAEVRVRNELDELAERRANRATKS